MHAQVRIPPLAELEAKLAHAKSVERDANLARIAVEREILAHPDVVVEDEGTTTVGNLKIETGYTRKFDQAKLAAIAQDFPPELWPFKTEYSEVRRGTRYLENNQPELWDVIAGALTLTPRKPAITLKEPK